MTTRDLAWQCGLAMCDTVEAVDALARAGLCANVPADLPAAGAGSGQPLPQRRPSGVPLPAPAPDDLAVADDLRVTPPPLESLRRVLEGLRRLN